jgi:hypothetical protein
MAITNYVELLAAGANWLARDDLSSRFPEFVALTEAKLNRVLFVPQMEVRSTATVDINSAEPEFISLPDDFQTMRRIRLSSVAGKPRLGFLTGTQIDDVRFARNNMTGQPAYFSIVGTEIELLPTPTEAYTIEMVYRANIPPLASNPTNWLLTLAPDLYLYGMLLEAAPYTEHDERVSLWASAFSTVLDNLNSLGNMQSFDSGPSTIVLPGITP